ncbi:sigma 54-interacting transcriptional regulator [Roseomonas sp. NAR14]|uniref:Sigma 54-interacting transcriptional regulator n=1 Tax=Roseomonas acroporae TaxID=2937791 RepID=A0A9X1Y926_9PROT|nr:sigma 54-interacting transcriptional regulator [Roseomonas acroporae]
MDASADTETAAAARLMLLVSEMASARDRGRAMQLCVEAARHVAGAEHCRLYAFDGTNTHLLPVAALPPAKVSEAPIPLYPGGAPDMADPRTWCAFSGSIAVVPDAQHAGTWDCSRIQARDLLECGRTHGLLACPLRGNDETTVGVLEVSGLHDAAGRELGAEAMRGRATLLHAFSYQAAVILANRALLARNEELRARLDRLNRDLREENERLRRERLSAAAAPGGLITGSAHMDAVLDLIGKVADSAVPVLIQGETGTGKEVVARLVHATSNRRAAPFVAQNCAALPAELLESELFGHRRGAFTGAHADKPGLFELADGGTLFLDEIGDMPIGLQAKLLRVLQDGEVRAVGATKPRKLDVRIVAATNAELHGAIAEGRFREDLYYRLSVFPLLLPPLREREGDVSLLAASFAADFAQRHGKDVRGIAPEAERCLTLHRWPGNVRELRNVMERAVILCPDGGEILPDHLPPALAAPRAAAAPPPAGQADADAGELRQRMARTEVQQIQRALRETGGNVTHAARALGLSRRTLHEKLARHGLDRHGLERAAPERPGIEGPGGERLGGAARGPAHPARPAPGSG